MQSATAKASDSPSSGAPKTRRRDRGRIGSPPTSAGRSLASVGTGEFAPGGGVFMRPVLWTRFYRSSGGYSPAAQVTPSNSPCGFEQRRVTGVKARRPQEDLFRFVRRCRSCTQADEQKDGPSALLEPHVSKTSPAGSIRRTR